jgi:hypothetical protein
MTPENARRVANGILVAAGVTLAVVIVREPRLRRMLWRLLPIAAKQVRPVHIAAALSVLGASAAAAQADER